MASAKAKSRTRARSNILVAQVEGVVSRRHIVSLSFVSRNRRAGRLNSYAIGRRWKLPAKRCLSVGVARICGSARVNAVNSCWPCLAQLEKGTTSTRRPSTITAFTPLLKHCFRPVIPPPYSSLYRPIPYSTAFLGQATQAPPSSRHSVIKEVEEGWLQHCASREEDSPNNTRFNQPNTQTHRPTWQLS